MNDRFRFFSLIFSFPTEKTLAEIENLTSVFPEYTQLVKEFLRHSLDDLQAEYTRLFVTGYPTLSCPPYESYYREGSVYGNSSIEVKDIYESHGLEYSFEGEPADHISVELEFLALTGDMEFARRMKEWLFQFTERVKKNSKIYGPVAEELEKFIRELTS